MLSCYILIYIYYYYSHIYPGFRAQHCNYATLLAGRCILIYILLVLYNCTQSYVFTLHTSIQYIDLYLTSRRMQVNMNTRTIKNVLPTDGLLHDDTTTIEDAVRVTLAATALDMGQPLKDS